MTSPVEVLLRRQQMGIVGADSPLKHAMRKYVAQRGVAGASWGEDSSLGFNVPNIEINVVNTWGYEWLKDGNTSIANFGNRVNIGELEHAVKHLETELQQLPPLTETLTIAGVPHHVLKGANAERFWKAVMPVASIMDNIGAMPTGAEQFAESVKESASDLAKGAGKVAKDAASGIFSFLTKPLIIAGGVAVGLWYLLGRKGN